MLSTLAFAGMVVSTMAHGRLTKPMTRIGNTGYENDPIGFGGRPASQYICRHDAPNTALTPDRVTAGEKLTVQWITTAAHVGDCALYMSYDGDKDLEDMRWFKIANKQDCKSLTQQDVTFDLPPWLPGGAAVLRWEWYALHVHPAIEFYAQCSDIIVNPSMLSKTVGEIPMFKIFENGKKTSLPLDANTGVGFRNAFGNQDQHWSETNPNQYMTGPECALNSDLNDCALTAPGMRGHVSLPTTGGGTPVTTPTPNPTMAPVASPTQPPVVTPTQPPVVTPTQPPVVTPTQPPVVQPPVVSPTQPPVVTPTQPPNNNDCSTGLFGAYEQCAGDGFTVNNPNGCALCPAGYQCYQRSKWYSNCNHSCPQGLGWDCEGANATPSAPPATAPTYEMTAPTDPPTDPPTDEAACPNGQYATCGGVSFPDAPHCCQEGLYCKAFSAWYSHCEKEGY